MYVCSNIGIYAGLLCSRLQFGLVGIAIRHIQLRCQYCRILAALVGVYMYLCSFGMQVFLIRLNWNRNSADPITIAILPNYGCTYVGMQVCMYVSMQLWYVGVFNSNLHLPAFFNSNQKEKNIETALKPLGNPRKLELLCGSYVGMQVLMYISMFIVKYVSMHGCYVAVCDAVKLKS